MEPAQARTQFRLLGPLEIVVCGTPIDAAGGNLRLLLAMLALRRGQVCRTDSLAAELWGPTPQIDVPGSLQALVSRARRAVAAGGVSIVARAGGYLLSGDGTEVDAEQFAELSERARAAAAAGRLDGAADAYRTALALWRGPALGEFAEHDFARTEGSRLEEARAATTEALAQVLLADARPGEAVALLEPHVAEYPYREDAVAALLLALHRAGRRADALATYRTVRQKFVDELGLEPGEALRRLEALLLSDSPELGGPSPAGPVATAPGHNLPAASGRFLGREAELAELLALVREHRLLTLWGPGGAGKTSLGIQLATRCLPDFRDGVRFVELAPVDRSEAVGPAVMAALGMLGAGRGDPIDAVTEYLSTRQTLIVLDNCEHLAAAAAHLVHALLTRCPAVSVIATSREPLAVPDECVWPTPPLSLPAGGADLAEFAECDAARLFTHRARLAHPSFALTASNATAVAEICRRLDGMPLALELAAARVRAFGVQGVCDRLDDRFGLLTSGHRTAAERHRTLHATVSWSYELLCPAEQQMLARLSVFPADFDAGAAAAVAAPERSDAAALLAGLVERCLVIAADTGDGGVRYRLLETIRQYAAEELARAALTGPTRFLHLQHYRRTLFDLDDVYARVAEWDGPQRERENLRAAILWALEAGDAPAATSLAARLWTYWAWAEDPADAPSVWLTRVLAMPGFPADAEAVLAMSALAWFNSDSDSGYRALALADRIGDARACGRAHWALGVVLTPTDSGRARKHFANALETTGGAGAFGAFSRHQLAWLAVADSDLDAAREHAALAVAMTPAEGGSRYYRAIFEASQAVVLASAGEHTDAEAAVLRALRIARNSPLVGLLLMAQVRAATVTLLAGQSDGAAQYLAEVFALLRRVGTRRWAGDTLQLCSALFAADGRRDVAARVLRAADQHGRHHDESPALGIPAVTALVAPARIALEAAATSPNEFATLDEALRFAEAALAAR